MVTISPQIVMRNVKKLGHYYSKFVINGHSDYTRYIILGRSRTGSNFLRGLMNTHPQIISFGEIFMNFDKGWGLPAYPRTQKWDLLLKNDPVRFLEEKIFIKAPGNVRAVGFKIFYYHAKNPEWQSVWSYLLAQKNIKVIHLKRRNILKTHLSLQRAERSRQWVDKRETNDKHEPITLHYDDCAKAFAETRDMEQEYGAMFSDHDCMDVYYEDLAKNTSVEMARVQAFLGVDQEKLEPLTYKQTKAPIAQLIANYSELKQQFSDSPWQEFFQE